MMAESKNLTSGRISGHHINYAILGAVVTVNQAVFTKSAPLNKVFSERPFFCGTRRFQIKSLAHTYLRLYAPETITLYSRHALLGTFQHKSVYSPKVLRGHHIMPLLLLLAKKEQFFIVTTHRSDRRRELIATTDELITTNED